ncbi:hypothetical protein EXS70_03065 [Candidatus Peribacteria bacterium]|nr:hypothetical protein [Candidatus Peribacteria bacterium]
MQKAESLQVHLYFKGPTRERLGDARAANTTEVIVSKSLEIAGRFDEAGKRLGIPMQWKSHQWPKLHDCEDRNLLGDVPGTSRFPDGVEFDADMAVCVLHQLQDADAVVGHLLLRNRQPLYLCLCTIEDLPNLRAESTQNMLRGILAIPSQTSAMGNGLVSPHAQDEHWTSDNNPLKKGRMSIRPADELSQTYIQSVVQSLHFEKFGL